MFQSCVESICVREYVGTKLTVDEVIIVTPQHCKIYANLQFINILQGLLIKHKN